MYKSATYTSTTLSKIIELAEEGLRDSKIAVALGVNIATFSNWKRTKPEVYLALEQARAKVHQKVEDALIKRALGYDMVETHIEKVGTRIKKKRILKAMPPDVKAIEFYLTNRVPEDWSSMQKLKVETSGTVDINSIDVDSLSEEKLQTLAEAIRSANSKS